MSRKILESSWEWIVYYFSCKEKYEQWNQKQVISYLFQIFPFCLTVTVFYLFQSHCGVEVKLKWLLLMRYLEHVKNTGIMKPNGHVWWKRAHIYLFKINNKNTKKKKKKKEICSKLSIEINQNGVFDAFLVSLLLTSNRFCTFSRDSLVDLNR